MNLSNIKSVTSFLEDDEFSSDIVILDHDPGCATVADSCRYLAQQLLQIADKMDHGQIIDEDTIAQVADNHQIKLRFLHGDKDD